MFALLSARVPPPSIQPRGAQVALLRSPVLPKAKSTLPKRLPGVHRQTIRGDDPSQTTASPNRTFLLWQYSGHFYFGLTPWKKSFDIVRRMQYPSNVPAVCAAGCLCSVALLEEDRPMKRIGIAALLLGVCLAAGCTTQGIYEIRLSSPLSVSARPGDRVFVDVKNVSAFQNIMLAEQVRNQLQAKGYAVVPSDAEAEQEVRLVVRFAGLYDDAVSTGNILTGAAIGGVVGGLGGMATGRHHRVWRRGAGGALLGAATGAGVAYLLEEVGRKNTFVIRVDAEVKNKRENRISSTSIEATVGEKGLTADAAIMRVVPDIAFQVTGLF